MAQAEAGHTAPAKELGVALLRGKIVSKPRSYSTRDGAKRWATLIALPAEDEFGGSSRVEVRSAARLGEVGDTWAGKVRISGSVRTFRYTDKHTGEELQGNDCSIWLTAVGE